MPTLAAQASGALLLCVALHATGGATRAVIAQNFSLPPLPYGYSALEPVIDTQTMKYHHDVHHLAYVNNLNAALAEESSLSNLTLTQLVQRVGTGQLGVMGNAESTIQNQGGGAWNHAFFWKIMAPPGSADTSLPPNTSALGQAVVRWFGSWDAMKEKVNSVGAAHFGSGFVWLVYNPRNGKLQVVDTSNQNNPLSGKDPLVPILGQDVWEHAYYLKHGPAKSAYLSAWWGVANWKQVEANFVVAQAGNYSALIGDADMRG